MRLYLDCCCYNRPFDAIFQNDAFEESNSIISIIIRASSGNDQILGSTILDSEINKIKDLEKKFKVQALYKFASIYIPYTLEIQAFAKKICEKSKIHFKDSLHLASAKFGNADIFLTTDYRLIRSCKNIEFNFKIMNPINYFAEVLKNGENQFK